MLLMKQSLIFHIQKHHLEQIRTYEETKTPIMLMENCCYDRFELLATAMARRGLFGEIVHCRGAYGHDIRDIVANILTAVLPEQAGIWSYPRSEHMEEKDIDNECVIMNMINSMIGRVHLASKLYLLNEELQKLIKEGIDCYKYLVQYRNDSIPFFPYGLAKYGDKHLAFGYKNDKKAILFVYNLKDTSSIKVKLKNAKRVKLIYPLNETTNFEFINQNLIFKPHREKIARVFEIDY